MTLPERAYQVGGYLGEILVRDAGLRPEYLQRALEKQKEEGGLIGEILVRMQAIKESDLARALAVQFEMPFVDRLPAVDEVDVTLLEDLPINFAKQHRALPYARDEGGRVLVAIAEPLEIHVLDDIRGLLGAPVEGVLAAGNEIIELINKVYGKIRAGAELAVSDEESEYGDAEELVDILDLTDEAPIIRWVNSLLFQSVKERASDIHIEPGEKEVHVRFRVDGRLRETKRANRQYLPSIVARIKIMAGLDIAEKRLPQDGRIRRKIGGKDVDMRVATAPTAGGERITIRLLDRSSVLLGLDDVGMAADLLGAVRGIIKRPNGILLVTGPTGSGKTTTLYGCLSEINSPDKNILTIEDPVEYQLEGISQTQVNPKIDLSFANGMRSFLRHDPDVIMVGEIRDREHRVADRSLRVLDHPHQRRRWRHHAARGHEDRAVPGCVVAGRLAGSAPGAHAVQGVRANRASVARGRGRDRPRAGPVLRGRLRAAAGQGPASARPRHRAAGRGLHRVLVHRLHRPNRHLRAAHGERRGP
jgi:general secretion pathway protein E